MSDTKDNIWEIDDPGKSMSQNHIEGLMIPPEKQIPTEKLAKQPQVKYSSIALLKWSFKQTHFYDLGSTC